MALCSFRIAPCEDQTNLARAHGKREWTVTELQDAILDEFFILEMGSPTPPPTEAFVANLLLN